MRKLVSLMLLGASWVVFAGCEQQDSLPEPADGGPENQAPRSEPNLDTGGADEVDPVEPADPGIAPGGAPPGADEPAGAGGDIGGGQAEPPEQPPQPPQPPQQ